MHESFRCSAPLVSRCVQMDDAAQGYISLAAARDAIRSVQKLRFTYRGDDGTETTRTVRSAAIVHHLECAMVAVWCELRGAFRHFLRDRIWGCNVLEESF